MNLTTLLRLHGLIPKTPTEKNWLPMSVFEGTNVYSVAGETITVNKADERGWGQIAAFSLPAGKYVLTKSDAKCNMCLRTSADNYSSNTVYTSALTTAFTVPDDADFKIKIYKGNHDGFPFDTTAKITSA